MLTCAHELHSTAVRMKYNQQSQDSTKKHSDSRKIKPNEFFLEWTNYKWQVFFFFKTFVLKKFLGDFNVNFSYYLL